MIFSSLAFLPSSYSFLHSLLTNDIFHYSLTFHRNGYKDITQKRKHSIFCKGQHKLKFNRHFEELKDTIKSGSESHTHTSCTCSSKIIICRIKLDLNLIFPLSSLWTSVLGLCVDVLASRRSMLDQISPLQSMEDPTLQIILNNCNPEEGSILEWLKTDHGPHSPTSHIPWGGQGRGVSSETVEMSQQWKSKLSLGKRRGEILL